MRAKKDRPSLAPLDPLAREIHRVLDLIMPVWGYEAEPKYDGYCGAATEAYLHLAGGRDAGLRVKRRGHTDGTSHWWLEGASGVVDLTYGPADRRRLKKKPGSGYPYEKGKGAMFQNGYVRPSKRAAAIIELVRSRR